ncbi:MAG: type II toxin-antitoxin system VapC family toxin [Acidobacteriota bacterium]
MIRRVVLDIGPLVALLNRRDRYHAWAKRRFAAIEPPLLSCEPVLVEAAHLLRHQARGPAAVLALLERGTVTVALSLEEEAPRVRELMVRYADQPMALADACLVRMAELHAGSRILTLDSDFTVYRMHGRRVIPTIRPDEAS